VTALLFGAFLTWASYKPMAEAAMTIGQIVPRQSVLRVQHLEGGIVREVLVEEGQRVAAGDPLVRLRPEQANAEEGQLLARRAALELQAERLRASSQGSSPDFAALTIGSAGHGGNGLGSGQLAMFQAQQQALADRQAVLTSRLEQRRAERQGILSESDALARRIAALRQEQGVYNSAVREGVGSRVNLLRAQGDLANAEAERARLAGRLQTVEAAIGEAEMQVTELLSSGKEQLIDQLNKVMAELGEVEEALGRSRDRVKRLELRAPADGMVKGLAVKMAGEVVSPGQVVLEVVPTSGGLAVESRVATKDVGSLSVGQPVTVKVTAYDFARFGAVAGTLEQISATTFLDENGQPYYKARIGLAQDWVGRRDNVVLPGMVVQADITTGEKTLLQYLLKPIYVALGRSFTER
jgi:HlyD family type I secretion membrane fusion protein